MKLQAVIIEDEVISRDILRNYIKKYCPTVELLGEADNINDGQKLIENNSVDLVFLDVEMPYGTGFDLLDKVEHKSFETVFVTAYDHYAIDALNYQATYYLLKPISIDELIKSVEIVTDIKQKENNLINTVLQPKTPQLKGKVTLPQQDGFEVLNTEDILFCKADDNYTEIYLEHTKKVVSKTLKYFEEALKESGFARVHKSYLVNVNHIVKYKKGKGGSVVLSNGSEVMVAASKKANILSYFK